MPGPGDRIESDRKFRALTNRLGGKKVEHKEPTWKEYRPMIKPGWKTTEFWVTILTAIFAATGWEDLPIELIAGLIALVISYTLGRSVAKIRR